MLDLLPKSSALSTELHSLVSLETRDGAVSNGFSNSHLCDCRHHSWFTCSDFKTRLRSRSKNEEHRVRSILIVSLVLIAISATIVTILILIFAPVIANTLLTDSRAMISLIAIAPIIPIIGISSVFRGYFQGRQNMNPYAISQLIEQSARIFTVILLAQYLLPFGIAYAAAGAMIGMVIGEGLGMLFLLYSFKRDPKKPAFETDAYPKRSCTNLTGTGQNLHSSNRKSHGRVICICD